MPQLTCRRRTDAGPEEFLLPFDPARTAVILCDVWDHHWCRGAERRLAALIPRLVETVGVLRRAGATVIHAPSETMAFYQDWPQRQAAIAAPRVLPPPPREIAAPPLPIDDSDGGCDVPGDHFFKAWSRQHPAVPIFDKDFISDNGAEVYSILSARRIERLLVAGVHANMCILNRTFAIRQMTRWGVACTLIRDLTDSMYNPAQRPQVPHDQGTALVINYIERHWCPSTTSAALLAALA
jgi:nicotinamidase-related amidase